MPPPTDAVGGRLSQAAVLASVQELPGANTSQIAVLASVAPINTKHAETAQFLVLAAVRPVNTRHARTSQESVLAAYNANGKLMPRTSQMVVLASVKSGIPGTLLTRVWEFELDGHTFYVMALGEEGTFLYDEDTQQWAQWDTDGYGAWNMDNGIMWNGRVVAGDLIENILWELDPSTTLDDAWRLIHHVVTGGIDYRSRTGKRNDSLRLAATVGDISPGGTEIRLRISDDRGHTWSDYFVVPLTQGDFSGEIAWRSLGAIQAPGRVYEISDFGGSISIFGADADIEGIDHGK